MSTSESSDRDVGTFASGESDPKAHPDEEDVGTFATGEEQPNEDS